MEIRAANRDDLPDINRIYNQAVRKRFSTAHLEPVSPEEREHWFVLHDPARFPVFVASLDGGVVGWVSLGPYRKERQALAHVAEVSYYVDEEKRGLGYGSALLEFAMQHAKEFGFSILIAILLDKNAASIGLLEKYGFQEWGRMPEIALIDGQKADHLYYGLTL
jgi:phosphinothricin acetyltransferase